MYAICLHAHGIVYDAASTAVFQVLAMQSVMRYTSMYVRSCSIVDFQ